MKIGFIGLGNVGGKLSGSLIRNGHEVAVHDLNAEFVAAKVAAGARDGKSPAELAGIELPTSEWLELLGLPADEVPAAQGSEAAPPAPSTAAARAKTAA